MGAIDPCSHKSSALQLYRALVLLLWVSFLAHVQSASFPAVDSDLSWIETLSWKPRAFLWHNFLSNEEADHIIRIAKPFLKRSTVVGQGGKATITDVRSSYGTFLGRLSDPIVAGLEERVAQWTHINVSHQEDLQILRYEHMQSYRPHHDSLIEDGPRIATVLLYLSDAAEGGETAFPDHSEWLDESLPDRFGPFSNCARGHVAVKPRKGDALLFYSMKPTGDLDPASLHTGCPVLEGTKWTATVWIHSKPFRIDDLYVGEVCLYAILIFVGSLLLCMCYGCDERRRRVGKRNGLIEASWSTVVS